MMQPKKVKYRKIMKGRVRGAENRGVELAFGDYGLKSLETCRVDTRALEAECLDGVGLSARFGSGGWFLVAGRLAEFALLLLDGFRFPAAGHRSIVWRINGNW